MFAVQPRRQRVDCKAARSRVHHNSILILLCFLRFLSRILTRPQCFKAIQGCVILVIS